MRSLFFVSLALFGLMIWLVPAPADAQPLGASEQQLTTVMEDYFSGEKAQAWAFLGIGTVGLGTGAYLFARGDARTRGASYPVLAIGLIEALAGTAILLRTPSQVSEARARIASDPAGFKATETDRMEGVMTRFTIVEYAEAALILTGLGLFTYGSLKKQPTLEGIGLGLAASTAVLLALDFTADGRGDAYTKRLRGFEPTVTTSGMSLGYRTVF